MLRLFTIVLLSSAAAIAAADEDNLKPYPPAPDGMTRHVLRLPKEHKEGLLKVELFVGRTEMTDDVNSHGYTGKIEESVVEGWGYPKYTVKSLGEMMSTLVGVDPKKPLIQKFVSIPPLLIRYNSRIPVVVYTPRGVEVQYRLWRADPDLKPIAP